MGTALALTLGALFLVIIFGSLKLALDASYRRGYVDGYNHVQIRLMKEDGVGRYLMID